MWQAFEHHIIWGRNWCKQTQGAKGCQEPTVAEDELNDELVSPYLMPCQGHMKKVDGSLTKAAKNDSNILRWRFHSIICQHGICSSLALRWHPILHKYPPMPPANSPAMHTTRPWNSSRESGESNLSWKMWHIDVKSIANPWLFEQLISVVSSLHFTIPSWENPVLRCTFWDVPLDRPLLCHPSSSSKSSIHESLSKLAFWTQIACHCVLDLCWLAVMAVVPFSFLFWNFNWRLIQNTGTVDSKSHYVAEISTSSGGWRVITSNIGRDQTNLERGEGFERMSMNIIESYTVLYGRSW